MTTQPNNQDAECQQVSKALSAHFDGAANDAEKQLATAHLAHCAACAQMWREWQSLRLMEQRALEPVASGDMLPFAPVKVPRHLKAAILRQTVSPPIWQRFWPRLLTGMAVPTFAVACWLLIMAAPWQQSMTVVDTYVPDNPVATVPDKSVSTPPAAAPLQAETTSKEKPPEVVTNKTKAAPANTPKPVIATTSKTNTSRSNHHTESKSVSVAPAPRIKQSPHTATAPANNHTAKSTYSKSTFTPAPEPKTQNPEPRTQMKPPQVSMASLDRPTSRAAKSVDVKTAKPVIAVAPKPRATAPVLVAELPAQNTIEPINASSDPVSNYIAQNDVRPDDIRQAVENYRAALLNDGADL